MHIQFDKVVATNFMSIGNSPVEWDISKYKKVLINGKNGSGKTTLFQALTFGLFNRAYAKIKKQNLVNTINEKGTKVSVYFTIGDKKYIVERTIKPDSFKIFIDDSLLEQTAIKGDYQEYLEKNILKMDFKSYSQLVVLASTGYTPFLELKSADRRAFIESFLDIDIFANLNKELKKDVDINNKVISETDIKLSATESHLKLLIEYIESFSNIKTNKSESELNSLIEDIKVKYSEYKKLEDDFNIISQYKELYKKEEYEGVESRLSQIDKDDYLNKNKQDTIRKSIQFFNDNPTCPKCNQTVDASHKQSHLTDYNSELYNIQSNITQNNIERDRIILNKILILNNKKEDEKVKNQISEMSSKLKWMKANIKELYNKKIQLENSAQEIQPSIDIDKKKVELQELTKQYEELQDISNKSLTKKKYYDRILLSLKDSGAKAEIINDYVPIISGYVNNTLERLNIYLKFELDGEFNETLKSRHRDELQYESFSVGERMRLNVALLWAWKEITKTRTGISTNLLAIDEVLENVDINGFEDFLSLVDSDKDLNCVIISHKSGIETMFDKVIEVKKVKGFTKISIE